MQTKLTLSEEISPVVTSLIGVATMDVKGKGRDEIAAYLEEKHP